MRGNGLCNPAISGAAAEAVEKERGTHRPQNHSAPLPAIIIEAAGREYERGHARAPHARACARHHAASTASFSIPAASQQRSTAAAEPHTWHR